ncbi:MAG: hypothetical protein ABI488_14835 [Polyangiaceae bacterium]
MLKRLSSPLKRRAKSPPGQALLATGSLALLLLASGRLQAAQSCVSRAYGVPGLFGSPVWVPTGPAIVKANLDDPRWAGSTRLYFPADTGSGQATEATVRALVDGTTLTLSYEVDADPATDSEDTVWLGIGKGAAQASASSTDQDNFLLQVSLGSATITSGTLAGVLPASSVTAWTNVGADPSAWTQDLGHPWFDTNIARVWVGDSTVPYKWAVNVKIDLSTIGIGGSTLDGKLFVASFVDTALGSGWIHQWPNDVVTVVNSNVAQTEFSQNTIVPTKWGDMTLPASFLTPCTDGISLEAMQIGASPPPDNLINTLSLNSSHADNDFFAYPSWNSVGIGLNAIKARFRLAEWGSQQIASPTAPWVDLFTTMPENDASGHVDRTCAAGAAACGSVALGKDAHQCMLVELSKGSGSSPDTLKFANDSVYRNMDFDTTSTLERSAQISIKGLKPLAGSTARDVYVWVKTTNMPPPGNEERFLPLEKMQRDAGLARNPPRRPMQQPGTRGDGKALEVVKPAGKLAAPRKAEQAPLAKSEPPSPIDPDLAKNGFEHMEESWPTYEVHVYYDTGNSVVVRGRKYKLLQPQLPFGYFITHAGPYFGFEHAIEGIEGAKLEQIGPSFYRISVPNEGAVRVKSTIIALEKPTTGTAGCPTCCPLPVKVESRNHCACSLVRAGTVSDLAAALTALGSLGLLLALRRNARRPQH